MQLRGEYRPADYMQVTKFMLPAGIINYAATCRKINDLEVKNANYKFMFTFRSSE